MIPIDPTLDNEARSYAGHLYRRPVAPLHFPSEELVPETNRHLEIRTALYLMLKDAYGPTWTIGSEQFVYFDAINPKRCLAPDVFVKLGQPHATFDSWKIWLRGTPEVGVEIVSPFDRGESWDDKLERYRGSAIAQVVRFDAENEEQMLRVWDHFSGDLVERAPDDPALRECAALGLWWAIVDSKELGPTLRLARDREGRDLLPTPSEARIHAEMAARAEMKLREEAERQRAEAERQRDALAAELAELRSELARLRPR